jgi:hypothetical protein
MTHPSRALALSFLFALGLILLAGVAAAETINCTAVTAVPFTISVPGVYCLTADMNSAAQGAAITVDADDVLLDLNGHQLSESGVAPNSGITVLPHRNVTIRNGTIRGFLDGVVIQTDNNTNVSFGHIVEDLRVERGAVGIFVQADRSIIRNNLVLDIGVGARTTKVSAFGIQVEGNRNRVLTNDVIRLVGIANPSYGIDIASGVSNMVAGNRVSVQDAAACIHMTASTKYRDNMTSDCLTGYDGGINAGNND